MYVQYKPATTLTAHMYNTHTTQVGHAVHTHTTGVLNADTSYQNTHASILSVYTHVGC